METRRREDVEARRARAAYRQLRRHWRITAEECQEAYEAWVTGARRRVGSGDLAGLYADYRAALAEEELAAIELSENVAL